MGMRWLILVVVAAGCSRVERGGTRGEARAAVPAPSVEVREVVTVAPGDTLSRFAKERYGSEHYAGVIALANRLPAGDLIEVGRELELPELAALVQREHSGKAAEAFALVASAHRSYRAVEPALWQRPAGEVPAEIGARLDAAARELEDAASALAGVGQAVPRSTMGQLRGAAGLLREAKGPIPGGGAHTAYTYALSDAHRRLALGIQYGIVWARAGYR